MNGDRQRRLIRLPGYDYGQAGAYFVTICTHNRRLLFQQDAVRAIAERCWREMPVHFPNRDTLPVIVRTYKAAVTMLCRRQGFSDFRWQRNYYERIIHDDAELDRTRRYIANNPIHWKQDEDLAR